VAHPASAVRRLAGRLLPALWLAVAAGAAAATVPAASPASPPQGEWKAFFASDRGATKAVVEPIGTYRDKEWLSLQFSDYQGPKIRLAIMKVENRSAAAEQAPAAGDPTAAPHKLAVVPVSSLLDLLTTAAVNTHRFEVLERKEIGSVLSEQDLGASGRVQTGSAAKTGEMQGAQYMLYASVNDWTPEKSQGSAGGGSGRPGVLSRLVNVQKSSAEVAMSFRILDASSGQILFSTVERATADNWGVSLGGGQQGGGGAVGFKNTSPISYAVQACLNKGIYKLAMWVKDRPWRGRVVKIAGARVYIGAGSNDGITAGLVLDALARGDELVDPATGKSLGATVQRVGTVQVTSVEDQYAIATVVDGCQQLKAGDQVELRTGR
jgi:curli biogenesis system outer membrane secretion channel CsgG